MTFAPLARKVTEVKTRRAATVGIFMARLTYFRQALAQSQQKHQVSSLIETLGVADALRWLRKASRGLKGSSVRSVLEALLHSQRVSRPGGTLKKTHSFDTSTLTANRSLQTVAVGSRCNYRIIAKEEIPVPRPSNPCPASSTAISMKCLKDIVFECIVWLS